MDGAAAATALRSVLPAVRGRSALYERLLAGLAGAAERGFDGGAIERLLTASPAATDNERVLLLLSALHHAALEDPSLPHAAWYDTAVDDPRPASSGAPGALALAHLVEHEEDVAGYLEGRILQTNEVGRCTGLLPAFLIAAGWGKPLRLIELGCSAGLNLYADRYRYAYDGGPHWGPDGGPELRARAEGAVPRSLSPPSFEVAERLGVDLDPIDVTTEDGARRLHAYVWPDERDRHDRLHRAMDVARASPARLVRGDFVDWADQELAPADGHATVVYWSAVTHLLDDTHLVRLDAVTERVLRAATPEAPVAVVGFGEPRGAPPGTSPEVTIATADGDGPPERRILLSTDFHGRWVRWF